MPKDIPTIVGEAVEIASLAERDLYLERVCAGDTDLLAVLKPAQTTFRHPFVLQLESIAPEQATLLDVAGPVGGALVGACGLRPRQAGPGWQWFCELSIEPVSVALHLHDPLLGQISLIRPLLPAMKLLDWSLG